MECTALWCDLAWFGALPVDWLVDPYLVLIYRALNRPWSSRDRAECRRDSLDAGLPHLAQSTRQCGFVKTLVWFGVVDMFGLVRFGF